ncbi:MAG: sugar phosphate isomerase/epimerase, partial [Bacteroidetes bacterium]|nr:sugar phosphate isomerase/epimerase [Bacteroidota bacterium]
IGLDGVQVNLGTRQDGMHLRNKTTQIQFRDKAKETGIAISSLAIGELNNVPYKSDNQTDAWVFDAIDAATFFNVKVVLLAFFSKNDLRNDAKGVDTVIQKLKQVMPYAEKNKITLGIESYLTAEEHLDIMEKVGSDNLKVYYDFRNAQDAGNDIYHEIKLLGNKNICELHLKENGAFLGKADIDWVKVSRALNDINFHPAKWMQIEGALPPKYDFIHGHQQNLTFLKSIFNA